jgi:hypothetical protein
VFALAIFLQLVCALQGVCVSSLRVLQQRFWRSDQLELFVDVLQLVKRAGWSRHTIEAALHGWTGLSGSAGEADGAKDMDERRQVTARLTERVEQHLCQKRAQRRLYSQRELDEEPACRLSPDGGNGGSRAGCDFARTTSLAGTFVRGPAAPQRSSSTQFRALPKDFVEKGPEMKRTRNRRLRRSWSLQLRQARSTQQLPRHQRCNQSDTSALAPLRCSC